MEDELGLGEVAAAPANECMAVDDEVQEVRGGGDDWGLGGGIERALHNEELA